MFIALTRALNTKERLIKFRKDHVPAANAKWKPKDDTLTPSDWYHFERLHGCLEAFYAATMVTEGYRPTLDEWFTSLHGLMNEINIWEVEARDEMGDIGLETALHAAWLKVEKYYSLTDSMPVYYAAIVLNPTLKTRWFYDQWTDDEQLKWIQPAIDKVRTLWFTYRHQRPHEPPTTRNDNAEDSFARLRNAKRLKTSHRASSTMPIDHFERYIASDPLPAPEDEKQHFDVIGYWLDRRQGEPELAQFALDVLSIPVMSDDNERSFSAAKDMITDRRNRLNEDIIEASQCLKQWLGVSEKEPIEQAFDQVQMNELDELEPLQ